MRRKRKKYDIAEEIQTGGLSVGIPRGHSASLPFVPPIPSSETIGPTNQGAFLS